MNASRLAASGAIIILCVIGVTDASRRGLDTLTILAGATTPSDLSPLDESYLAKSAQSLGAVVGTREYARLEAIYVATSRKYSAQPAMTLLHVVSGTGILLLAPLQLWARFRARHPRVHRLCGKVVLAAAAALAFSGAYFGWVEPTGGIAEATAVALFGGFFVFAGARAYVFVRRGDIEHHREWMIRMFAVALGSSTIRLVALGSLAAMNGGPGMVNRRSIGVVFWLGWLLTLAFAELWIRAHRRGRGATD